MTDTHASPDPAALPPLIAARPAAPSTAAPPRTAARPQARRLAGPLHPTPGSPPAHAGTQARTGPDEPTTSAPNPRQDTSSSQPGRAGRGGPASRPGPLSQPLTPTRDWDQTSFRIIERHGRLHLLDDQPFDHRAVREIRAALGNSVDGQQASLEADAARERIDDEIDTWQQNRLAAGQPPLTGPERAQLHKAVHDALFKLGRAQALLELPDVQDLVIRGPHNVRLRFADGKVVQCPPVADTDEELIEDIRRWASTVKNERPFNRANPHLDLALTDGSRLSASAWFTAWPTVTIRRHPLLDIDTGDLLRVGAIDEGMQALLRAGIRAGKTIVVSGQPKAGKTTAIRAVLNELHPDVPIATIETDFELHLHRLPHRHREVWPAQELTGGEGGEGGITVSKAIPISLRDSVNIIVVGEVRSDEVIAMLDAMQIGTASVSTIHASDARGTIDRIVSCAVRFGGATESWAYRQIAHTVDLIVHLAVLDEEPIGGRKLRFVDEIYAPAYSGDALVSGEMLYQPGPDGRGVPTGQLPDWIEDLQPYGFDAGYYLRGRRSAWPEPLPSIRNTRSGS